MAQIPEQTPATERVQAADEAAYPDAAPALRTTPPASKDSAPARSDAPQAAIPHTNAADLAAAARNAPALSSRPQRNAPPARAIDAPKLVIGRIDVVVVADAPPAPAARPAASDHGFMSRNYLKRL